MKNRKNQIFSQGMHIFQNFFLLKYSLSFIFVALPSRYRLEVNFPHRSSTLPIVSQRNIPLPTVTHRYSPLLTVTHRYTPLL